MKTKRQFPPPKSPRPRKRWLPFFDYGNIPMVHIFRQLGAEGLRGLRPKLTSAKRRYWGHRNAGDLVGDEARSALEGYAESLERDIASIVRTHSNAYWLHAYPSCRGPNGYLEDFSAFPQQPSGHTRSHESPRRTSSCRRRLCIVTQFCEGGQTLAGRSLLPLVASGSNVSESSPVAGGRI
jgi:hypothetical protein